jgi:hypothetical protein
MLHPTVAGKDQPSTSKPNNLDGLTPMATQVNKFFFCIILIYFALLIYIIFKWTWLCPTQNHILKEVREHFWESLPTVATLALIAGKMMKHKLKVITIVQLLPAVVVGGVLMLLIVSGKLNQLNLYCNIELIVSLSNLSW